MKQIPFIILAVSFLAHFIFSQTILNRTAKRAVEFKQAALDCVKSANELQALNDSVRNNSSLNAGLIRDLAWLHWRQDVMHQLEKIYDFTDAQTKRIKDPYSQNLILAKALTDIVKVINTKCPE